MSDTVKLNQCPKCGAPIPLEAPQGLCPRCVLVGAATATEAGVPATATSEIPSLERVGSAFPQLEVVELIGRGGMGFVFKARQPHLDRFVALKLLPDKLARDPRFAERFNREGRVLAKLNHPNIVSVYDFGQTEHFYFLLMEFVDGVNLRQAMKAGRFSPGEALAIVPKICEALQYAHSQGILHRDIKPENILLDARGNVKIADFGIAKLVGEEKPDIALTGTGAALGTPHYMAPEQLEKPAEVDHRADIYSLGVVFYEMLTGELPIGRFAAPSSKTPVGTAVDEVVFRTLEKDRERRYQSAGEMQTQVEHLGETGAAVAQPHPPAGAGQGRDVPQWSQKAVWGAVLTGLSLPLPVLMAVLAYFSIGHLGRGELLIGAGSLGLPGLIGTLLGWMALSDIRAHQGRLRGLPLAVFAALTHPLLALAGATLMIPWMLMARGGGGPGTTLPVAAMLVMLVPVGAMTFGIWAVFAAARWGANKSPSRQRGVLKWVFLGLMFTLVGALVLQNFVRGKASTQPSNDAPDAVSRGNRGLLAAGAGDTNAWIRFTFTAVELREVAGVRWLAIDYVDDVHGDCQKSFPWETTIPGFKAETRTSEFVKDHKDSPTVRHQRVEYRMPKSAPREQLERLRENLATALQQKSFRLELGEQQAPLLLFELPGAEGGSLKAWIRVMPPLEISSAVPGQAPLGLLRLVAARDYQNLVLFRFDSAAAHPLHQVVARFSGPELPPQVALVRPAASGPYVVPSRDEDMNTPVAEPVASGDPVGTNEFPTASAIAVECPGDYAFTFVLPEENLAREANRQLQQALAQPISLTAGKQILLFTIGERKAWLEARPFRPEPNKFAFFRHGGLSPALNPRSNYLENAVATIPPGHELKLVGRLQLHGQNQARQIFSITLVSGQTEPGIYWVTWYTLPNPQAVDQGEKEDWELLVHDPLGQELFRAQAPDGLKEGWHRRWLGEFRSAKVGVPIHQLLFQQSGPTASGRGPGYITLEMTLQRLSDQAAAAEMDEADKIRIKLAREQLEIARKRQEVGRATPLEVAGAEHKLEVAEARGDAVAVAQANLKFAKTSLAAVRSQATAGVVPVSELRAAEAQFALAEIELKQAQQKIKQTPQ